MWMHSLEVVSEQLLLSEAEYLMKVHHAGNVCNWMGLRSVR